MASPHIEIPGYRIEKRMAYGAQGEVFLATQVSLNRSVALKVVHHDPNNAAEIERLRREGELLARLDSRHVVKVHDYGTLDGFSYLAMELLDGENLDQYLQRLHGNGRGSAGGAGSIAGRRTEARGAPVDETVVIPDRSRPANGANAAHDPTRAVAATETATRSRRRAPLAPEAFRSNEHIRRTIDIGLDVCQGLIDLHGQNLLHRDLKPANIMLTPEGRAVITDLGLAKAPDLPRLSLTGQILGTPSYMSPEVADGRHPSARTDVYGLGTTLYHGLTGSPPFEGQSISKMMTSLVRGETEPIARLNPAVPKSLAEVVEMAIAPDPRDRHADAAAFHAALQTVRDGQRFASKWTFGRYYRRQRRWLRPGTVVLGLLLTLVGWALVTAPRTTLERLRDAIIAGRPADAHEILESTPDQERYRLLEQLEAGTAHADHPVFRPFVASERGLAVLQLGLLPRYSAALVAADSCGVAEELVPDLGEFVSMDARSQFLTLRPGFALLLLAAPHEDRWPDADGTALVYPILLNLAAHELGSEIRNHSFDPPDPTVARQGLIGNGAAFVTLKRRRGTAGAAGNPPGQTFAVAREEVPALAVGLYREWVGLDPDRARQFAHPSEPEEVLEYLIRMPTVEDPKAPARVGFWMAFRVAGYLGCRLPEPAEWELTTERAKAEPGLDIVDPVIGEREWVSGFPSNEEFCYCPYDCTTVRDPLEPWRIGNGDALRVFPRTGQKVEDLPTAGFRVYRSMFAKE